jgi:hypothetical protein
MSLAIATWRADAQKYWEEQLKRARAEHQKWLDASPQDRALLERRFTHGEQIPVPNTDDTLENALRSELLHSIPREFANGCSRYGQYTTVDIVLFMMRKLLSNDDYSKMAIVRGLMKPDLRVA